MTEDSLQNGCSSAGESKCGREDGAKFLDNLLANSTGFYSREGKAVGQAIDNLSPVPAKDGTGYKLSDEIDENGRQFVLNSEGEISFGMITEETNLPPAPILLSEGIITNPVTNDGYGLVHIEARHGEQIRNAGYKDVVSFIEDVARNYEFIREGVKRDGHQTYMLQLTDKHNNTLMVELSGDGTYWNINTAGIFKTSYGRNRKEVYNRHTTDKQSAETAEASLSGEQSGTTPSTSMNAPTSSADKGTTISKTSKEEAEKNAVPSVQEQVEGKENVGKKTRSLPLSEGEYADMRQARRWQDGMMSRQARHTSIFPTRQKKQMYGLTTLRLRGKWKKNSMTRNPVSKN